MINAGEKRNSSFQKGLTNRFNAFSSVVSSTSSSNNIPLPSTGEFDRREKKNGIQFHFFQFDRSINRNSVPMLRGIPMPPLWPLEIPSAPFHSLFLSTLSTLSSSQIVRMDKSSSGTMEVLIHQTLSSRICLILRVCLSQLTESSSSTIEVHSIRVESWAANGTRISSSISVSSPCQGLFLDSNNDLYCSKYESHQVLRSSLPNPSNPTAMVAGMGCAGSTATTLSNPWGIFVTDQFDLYVADSANNRIQLFREGEISATTVPINGTNGIIIGLDGPTGVMLDADGYLFILESNTHRVIGSDRWGFRCLVGCSGSSGSASDQLLWPRTMNFDRDGNLFVLDTFNHRVQKFLLATNSCSCKWNGFGKDLSDDCRSGMTLEFADRFEKMRVCFHLDSNSSGLTSTRINAGEEKIFFVINERTEFVLIQFLSSTSSLNNDRSSFIDRFLSSNLLVRSFNQPDFCPNASWNPNATTVTDSTTIGSSPYTLFVNTFNTLFVANSQNGRILIWRNGSVNPTTTILTNTNLSYPLSLVVTDDEEIFVDNGNTSNRVERWTSNGTQLPSPMSICSQCSGLFLDSNDQLYCSQHTAHQVLRRSLQSPSSPTMIMAGTGFQGSTATTLNAPYGIFVTDKFDFYVADSNNHRIQFFREGEINATTVPINGANGITITLYRPAGVILDADRYLFIVDWGNHRVIGSDRWGFRCLVGCSGSSGSASDQLLWPRTMNFDRDGNLFVLDTNNHRVQKFLLATNSCDRKWKNEENLLFFFHFCRVNCDDVDSRRDFNDNSSNNDRQRIM